MKTQDTSHSLAKRALIAASSLFARSITALLPRTDRRKGNAEILATFKTVLLGQAARCTVFQLAVETLAELAALIGYVVQSRFRTSRPNRPSVQTRSTSAPSTLLGSVLDDFHQAAKSLSRRPGYTGIAILILTVGIGAGTAIFSVLDPVLLQPDSFDRERTLIYLWQESEDSRSVSIADHTVQATALFQTATTLDGLATYGRDTVVLLDSQEPRRVNVALIDHTLLPLLRTSPILGRNFSKQDTDKRLVLIPEGMWHDHYDSDRSILGTTIEINDEPYEIIGVLPAQFTFPSPRTELWLPMKKPAEDPSALQHAIVARLAPGISQLVAQEEMDQLTEQAKEANIRVMGKTRIISHTELSTQRSSPTVLWILFGAVGILLLTACVNAASLALTLSTGRRKELAIRGALGASRGRLVRHLMAESLWISVLAGLAGLALAKATVPILLRLAPDAIRHPAEKQVFLDWRVLVFALVASLAVAGITGALPALRSTLASWANQRANTPNRNVQRSGTILASAQVAMAFVLVFSAGLLLRSFDQLLNVDPGFEPEHVLAIDINLNAKSSTLGTSHAAYTALTRRLEALPFVERSTTASQAPPRTGNHYGLAIEVEGREPDEHPISSLPTIHVGDGYFRLMKIPLLFGGGFQRPRENQDQVIISRSMAQRLFSVDDAVGKRLRLHPTYPWLDVVGIAADVEHNGPNLDFGDGMEAYFPSRSAHPFGQTILIKTDRDPFAHLTDIKAAIWQTDARLPLHRIRSLQGEWTATMDKPRFLLVMVAILASLTLLLTLTGMYAVLSASVVRRRREIGIRLALGAHIHDVLHLVLRQGVIAGTAGILIGLVAGVFGAGFLQSQLFQVGVFDSATLLGSVAATFIMVMLAAWVPARHAAHIEPTETLRGE